MKQVALILLFFISTAVMAQEKSPARLLVEEGVKLHDEKKYPEAIAKYKEALKLEPDNANANYELAFTLFATNSSKEAIPYLLALVKKKSAVQVSAYDMLGSIYDDQKETDKAIEYFNLGIKTDPSYQRLYYNLALTYAKVNKNKEAMEQLEKSLSLDPGHASSHRLYAVVAKAEPGNNIKALLAYYNFLMLEPATGRSAQAFKELQELLNSGNSKKDGVNTITLGASSKDTDLNTANLAIALASNSAGAIPGVTEQDKFAGQLSLIFKIVGQISEKKKDKGFFWKFYADYFYALSSTDFVPVATKLVSFSSNPEETKTWVSSHQEQFKGLSEWVKQNSRKLN